MTKIRKVEFSLQPNQRLIDALREALRDAKSGKIQGLAIAVVCVDDSPDAEGGRSTETVISFTDGWAHSLCAAANGLAFRFNYERYMHGQSLPDPKLTEEDE